MKHFAILLLGTFILPSTGVYAVEPPRGELVELHSCEVYAGGCVVNSEATLRGRYMVQAWNFTGGSHDGVEFKGLQAALLQASGVNLAFETSQPTACVLYVPESASDDQIHALQRWTQTQQPQIAGCQKEIRRVTMSYSRSDLKISLRAGDFLSLETAALQPCGEVSCGEQLWYTPRAPNSLFTVVFNETCHVRESALSLEWSQHGRRSVFLAQFGAESSAEGRFTDSRPFCQDAVCRH